MLRRRDLLFCAAALGPSAHGLARAGDEAAAFEATTLPGALQALGLAAADAGNALALKSLDLVEDGATVEVEVAAERADVRRLLLLVEKNPNPLVARFDLSERVVPALALRLKVAESGEWLAIAVDAAGRAVVGRRHVDVTIGGCGEGEIATDLPPDPPPPQPTRIRIRRQGSEADVRLLMAHVMETGLRKDAAGRTVPAWTIRDVAVTLNHAQVLGARWGIGVSRNPYLQFRLLGVAAGDVVGVGWTDTRGERRHDEAAVS